MESIVKNKLFYFIALPLVWFIIAIITANSYANRAWLLSVAPAVWIVLFKEPRSIAFHEFLFGGLAGIFVVCFVLFKIKIKPRIILISSVVTTFVLWIALRVFASKGTLIKVPWVVCVWFLCCFNFSLCLLPFLALPIKMYTKYVKMSKSSEDI
jgi:hypothetical protein